MTHQNKFGMFIHWGTYSMLGLHEQALNKYQLNRKEYEGLINKFNPVDYDPEKWVLLAKSAGMKYICFTTKHHDGFCMWDTKYTDYNVMNTPYGKDTLKMLADACKKHGMLLSLYYSNPDWHHENAYNPNSSHQWASVNPDASDLDAYRLYIKNQITELLTNYGPIYTFFWDIPPKIDDTSMNEHIRALQPDILINDRGWDAGDFSTPEREYEDMEVKSFNRMVEACNSLGVQSWGYRVGEDFYSMRHLITSIDRYMAMGASYLLNVGPDGNGVITEEYSSRLLRVGDWYNRMEGCLECAEPDSFKYEAKHASPIATKKNGKTYLHFCDGLYADFVALSKYPSLPKRVRLMNTGAELPFSEDLLPEFSNKVGVAEQVFLHICGIPVDELESEAIVLEIEW
ncbi:MAG: alpha-L-fucosidase [Clostridia bacterium]|nr:alpha-L-fucosidase [Clostridia bacterium]